MTPSHQSLSSTLKAATADLHDQAERHPLQRALIRGELSRELFTLQLSQLLLVHTSLEKACRQAAPDNASVASVVREEYFQQLRLKRDLAHWGFDPAQSVALTATREVCDRIEQLAAARPVALLGVLYVFEGSNNGARFIARAVRKAYDIEGNEGISFLDPYGDAQRQKWTEFKAAMDALSLSDDDVEAVVTAARDAFGAIAAIGDDLLADSAAQA